MDVDRFVRSKNWQTEFNSLNQNELVIASIFTLLTCPNYTCRKKIVFQRVLHLLKVRTSRGPKEEFRTSFNRVLQKMINPMKIFKEYNSGQPHPRVKFIKSDSSLDALDMCLKKYYKDLERINGLKNLLNRPIANQNGLPINFKTESKSEQLEFDEDIEDDFEEEESEIDIDAELEVENEVENNNIEIDLLGQFILDDLPELEPKPQDSILQNAKPIGNRLDLKELKNSIVSYFEELEYFEVHNSYPYLKIKYRYLKYNFKMHFDFNKLDQSIIIKSFIDLEEREAEGLLRNWSRVARETFLSIEQYRTQEYFVINRNLNLKRYEDEEVIPVIEDVIRTSKDVCNILYKYL